MKLATIKWNDSTSAALVTDDGYAPIRVLPGRADAVDVLSLIRSPLTETELTTLAASSVLTGSVTLLAPILNPPKNIFCVGKNYVEHVKEGAAAEGLTEFTIPAYPTWFSKPHTALTGHDSGIVYDRAFTSELDYEGELAIVIGRGGRNISASAALDHVFGYTIVNDVTARDVQQSHGQWFRGKGADTYAPCGPWIVPAADIVDPQNLRITTAVDGKVRQDDTTKNMIFDIVSLIVDLSQGTTLEPGDIIATGTPQGVAWGKTAPGLGFLEVGQQVTVEIEQIGVLSNVVAAL